MRDHFARTSPPGTYSDPCSAPLRVEAGTVSINEVGHAQHSQREFARDGGLHHGGKLRQAVARYGIPIQDWLDLSTGINPNGWPVPPLPPSAWSRLPEDEDGLEAAARSYYGTDQLLPVAGSQAAIQALPRLRPACRVGVLYPGYGEHSYAWRRAGHEVARVPVAGLSEAARQVDVLVVINPNNPTGDGLRPETLLDWRACLAAGWSSTKRSSIPLRRTAWLLTLSGPDSSCSGRSASSSGLPGRALPSCWPKRRCLSGYTHI